MVAAVAAVVAVLPLMVLEWLTASELPRSQFALPLFALLWVVAAVFVRILAGVLRSAREMRMGQVAVSSLMSLMTRTAFVGWLGWVWMSWVIDQWPCFLGATGC